MRKFKNDGKLTTRGEFVSAYAKGDKVEVLKDEGNLLQVIIISGESKGKVAYIDANLVTE